MTTDEESDNIRTFVCAQLRGEPDLSVLTLRVLKQRYLAHIGADSLSSDAKLLLKDVVKRELVKIQGNEDRETETKTSSNKRKREAVSDGEGSENEAEDESRAKKKRHQSKSSPESKNRKCSKSVSDDSENEDETAKEAAVKQKQKNGRRDICNVEEQTRTTKKAPSTSKKSDDAKQNTSNNSKNKPDKTQQVSSDKSDIKEQKQPKKIDKTKQQTTVCEKHVTSEDSDDQMEVETGRKETKITRKASTDNSDEENNSDSENTGGSQKISTDDDNEVNSDGSEDEKIGNCQKNNKISTVTPQSDHEDDSNSDHPDKKDQNENSSEDCEKENASIRKRNEEPGSDSSSLPSLEDETDNKKEKKEKPEATRKNGEKKGKQPKSEKEQKSIVRLKRYIALCGVRRNYKKLLENFQSIRSKVERLKKELEDLGVKGKPTMEKCKKIRKKRERAQELAELDASNIMTSKDRPKRLATLAWHEQKEPLSSTYQRTLDSDSDGDQKKSHNGHRRTEWTNLQGIISDDAESD